MWWFGVNITKKVPRRDFTRGAIAKALAFQGSLYLVNGYNFFLERVGTGLVRLYRLDDLGESFAAFFFQRCNYFLCHDELELNCLLDFFMDRYLLEIRIVLLQLNAVGGVLAVFGGNVPGSAGDVGRLLLGALQNYLHPVAFLCHLGITLNEPLLF